VLPSIATSSLRVRTPVLAKIDLRWSWTVWGERNSVSERVRVSLPSSRRLTRLAFAGGQVVGEES
jgi:hypothetical protein